MEKCQEFKEQYESLDDKDQWGLIFKNKDMVYTFQWDSYEFQDQTLRILLKDRRTLLHPKAKGADGNRLVSLLNYLGFKVETD